MTLRPATNLRRKVVKNSKNQDSIELIINELERVLIRSRVPLSPLRFERGMLTALRGFLLRYASQASKLDDESLSLRNKKKEAKTVSFFVVCCGRFLCLLREIFCLLRESGALLLAQHFLGGGLYFGGVEGGGAGGVGRHPCEFADAAAVEAGGGCLVAEGAGTGEVGRHVGC